MRGGRGENDSVWAFSGFFVGCTGGCSVIYCGRFWLAGEVGFMRCMLWIDIS